MLADEAADVHPPRRGSVYQFTIGTSDMVYTIPSGLIGRWITISTSAEIHYHFTDATNVGSSAVVANQASTEADGDGSASDPFVLTVHNSTGYRQDANTSQSWKLQARDTYLTIIAAAAGTEVTIHPSGP